MVACDTVINPAVLPFPANRRPLAGGLRLVLRWFAIIGGR